MPGGGGEEPGLGEGNVGNRYMDGAQCPFLLQAWVSLCHCTLSQTLNLEVQLYL